MMRYPVLVALALTISSVASAQTRDARLGRLDATTAATVQAIVDSATVAGIPAEPIVDKALQAAAMNRTPAQTLHAVRLRVAELRAAHAALAPATAAEITAGADAMRSGASAHTLSELRRARPSMELTVPIGVLADLIGRGVAADTAAALMLQLASMDMRDKELTEFRRMVDRDIALGALPTAAAAIRAEAAGVRNLDAATNATSGFQNNGPTAPRPVPPQRP